MKHRNNSQLAAEVNDEVIGTGIDFNPDRFHPYVYSLTKVEWGVVGTVTWASGLKRCDTIEASEGRKYDFNGVLYRTCKSLKLRVNNIGIYHATEFGVEGKCHIHFLVAREGLRTVTPEKFARVFEQQWSEGFRPYRFGKGYVEGGVGLAVVEPYDPLFGQRGVVYCLKREFDERGRARERYDYVSKKLFSIIPRADTRPIVPGLPSPHRVACSGSGRFFGQNLADFENAGQSCPNQCARSEASPQPPQPVVSGEPMASGQPGLNLVVETSLSARLGALRN